MSKIFKRKHLIEGVTPKKSDGCVRKKNIIINNRVTPEDKEIIYKRIELSGLSIQDYVTQSCKYNKVNVVGNVKTFDAIRKEEIAIVDFLDGLQWLFLCVKK